MQALRDNFHILENNSEKLEDVRILFLGNEHYCEDQHWKISWLIQQLYQEGDVVLVETFIENPKSDSHTKFVAKKIDLRGWDSPLRKVEFEQEHCLINVLLHIDRVRRLGLKHDNWIDDIHQLIRLFPPPTTLHDEIINENYNEAQLNEINSVEERLVIFNDLVTSLSALWLAHLDQQMMHNLVERNKYMIQTIDQHLKTSSRIFVIAGIAHLTLDKQFNHLVEETKDSVEIVHEYCSDKKFVVLYPTDDGLQSIKDELKPSLKIKFKRFVEKASYMAMIKVIFIASLLLLGLAVISLPFMIYGKIRKYLDTEDQYLLSLKKMPSEQLMVLIADAADRPESLPRHTGTKL